MPTEEWPDTCLVELDRTVLKRSGYSSRWATPCGLPEGHEGPHEAAFFAPDADRFAFLVSWPR